VVDQAIFPEGVNTIGKFAGLGFFLCLAGGAFAFFGFVRRMKTTGETGLGVWKDEEVRRAFFRFFLVWLASMICLAVAFTVGGWPSSVVGQ
jgi:hypothetical protein